MSNKSFFSIIIGLVALVVVSKSIYIIDETQKGLVLRFDKVIRDSDDLPKISEPGIHFKVPMADKVVVIDRRVQIMDGTPDVFTTQNKEFLDVDTYVQWKVKDFAKFYLRTSANFNRAEGFLEDFVDSGLRNQFGKRTLQQAISGEREELMGDLQTFVDSKITEYGMEVVDVRVKKVNYTSRVLVNVYEQIKSERNARAVLIRSDGTQKGNIVMAETDANVLRTLAEGDEYARVKRGEADGKAAKIYADTYNKDPEFYAFLRSLDAYKASFNGKDDIMVVQPDSDFFKYFKDSKGTK